MKKEFTLQAEKKWLKIPEEFREKVLDNVFCGKCGGSVRIKNYTGEIKSGDLVLRGECSRCGYKVARLIESD